MSDTPDPAPTPQEPEPDAPSGAGGGPAGAPGPQPPPPPDTRPPFSPPPAWPAPPPGYSPHPGYPGHPGAPGYPSQPGTAAPGDVWLRPPGAPGGPVPPGQVPPGAGMPPGPGQWPGGHWSPPPGQWGPPPGHWGPPPGWYPQPRPVQNRPLRVITVAAAVAVIAAVGVAVGRTSISNQPGITGNSSSTSLPADANTVAAKVDPGVVDVTTRLGIEGGEAAGTGMVLSSSGYVLTNNHVVDGATSVSVTDVGNGQTYTATVVGTDASDDIAVLKLRDASGLRTVSLGNSSSLSVGTALTAIGNAGGVGGTPSVAGGQVTALNQSITATDESDQSTEQLNGLIQTDAALQPGDSGGPLVNAKGQVVGMDTAASTGFEFQSGQSEGFAIPINKADAVAKQMMAGQSSNTVHIGPAALIGVDVELPQFGSGALVVNVEPGTPADDIGLVPGDVITSLGGQSVSSPTSLRSLTSRHHPGDKVQVGWEDESGASHSASIQLVTGPAQ